MCKIKVNGEPCSGNLIHAAGADVEILQNDQPLLLQFPKTVTIHDNRDELRIYGRVRKLEMHNNSATIQCFVEYCRELIIHNNAGTLHIYGDYNKVSVGNNLGTINVYGDHLELTVLDNNGKLYFYGVGNQVEIRKGEAKTYGHYIKTVIHPEAKARVEGRYQEVIDLGKIISITGSSK